MSGRFRHAQHVFRMAGLFVVGIVVFLVLRALYVPDDFGVLGHYRASALTMNSDKPLAYAGQAACADCHPDVIEKRAGQRHERVACEGCHGPSARHASGEEGAPMPARPDGRVGCLHCHAKDASRPLTHPQVIAAEHAGGESCLTCHNPHAPKVS
jgi:hypothetical protein